MALYLGSYKVTITYCEALGTGNSLLYFLPEETTFNGTSDYIDTKLALMSKARSFTIFADFTESESVAKGGQVFSCVQENGGYGGVCLYKYRYSDSNGYIIGGYPGNGERALFGYTFNHSNANGRMKVAIVFEEGVPARMVYKDVVGNVVHVTVNQDAASLYPFIHTRNILLGCRENGSQYENKLGFWAGTIHAFEVWANAMTDEEMVAKVEGK